MLTLYAVAYGTSNSSDANYVLRRQIGTDITQLNYPAAQTSANIGGFGNEEWTAWHRSSNTAIACTRLLEVDTDPPGQSDISFFGIDSNSNAASLCMPLDDGRFVIASGTYVYIQRPDDEEYTSRLFLSNSASGGAHNVVAIAKVGSTAKIMFSTRGNAGYDARVLTVGLDAPPSGTVDMLTLPSYGSAVEDELSYGMNWYSGLIPSVLGAFEYCVFRNADRGSDGLLDLAIGCATSPPYTDGTESKMSGYLLLVDEDTGNFTRICSATVGGTMSGGSLMAQSLDYSPIFTTDDMIFGAAGLDPDDFSSEAKSCGLQFSFTVPPVSAFWTNLRGTQEII
ncbi:hypothetical protein N5C80_26595 [Pseudomonas nicosulfuronedens]|uniref:hypothetical protein n=1 Tax=Pseudomonas nicosulfuronedens TaxID=2571105 RepID=UPI002449ECD7|nr:hypothetical protein [Pseudomonas nicosulfuronedens]MDH1012317.1 hypothetical protein [Pseudomonas nicosulfuronedens]MDH2030486.1 hypothetical protein [Pseudomonas nicosulfuronedens]